ncbi:hypothetical protein Goarm_016944, partial [Gossypium armourianum]|nr:hypothetical protein [Gossypium armourianum]
GGEGEGEGGEVAGSKGGEGVEGQGVGEGGEVAEGLSGEGDDVAVREGGESDGGGEEGVNATVSEGGESDGGGKKGVRDESDSDSEDENAYLMKFEAKVLEEVDGEGLNDSVSREEDGNETEYFDSDDHGSILGSEDDDNIDVYRRRSRFPTYNPNLASPHFCIGMLFKDSEQFKSAIRKY